jgi:hypothetical protein
MPEEMKKAIRENAARRRGNRSAKKLSGAGLTPLQQILKTSQPAVIDNQLYVKADCQ